MEWDGKTDRRVGTAHCDQHSQNTTDITSIKTTQEADRASSKTWRFVGSIAGGVSVIAISFVTWVANDTLCTLRTDIKDLKTIVQTASVAEARYGVILQNLERRMSLIEDDIQDSRGHKR